MPRRREPGSPRVVHRTARVGLRVTRAQRRRLVGLLVSAGDVWACVLEINAWRRALVPLRWYHGTFTLASRMLRIPVARGHQALWVRLDRDLPYPQEQVRSVTLVYDAGRLWADVTAEVPVACYPAGLEPDPGRVAGVDLGIIHPYAVAGPGGEGLLVSGRAIRAEHRMHLADTKARRKAVARRAPKPGQKGSRRWRHYRRRQRLVQARHRRRVRQAQHEAATAVIAWAVDRRIGTLAAGDPRGVLSIKAGRRHNQRTRDWRIGHLITALKDKAEAAGISLTLVDERGTSSTCPACVRRVPKPPGRVLACPGCQFTGHRDLTAAATIAARHGGGTTPASLPAGVTHRRAGAHLPGVAPSRRDPRRRAHHRGARGSPGRHRPARASPPRLARESLAPPARSLNTARNYRQVH